ncbi:hypothetical protein [Caudoviricetes sp.]|nr:hypothetical protein [Caudoviricetes sp.]
MEGRSRADKPASSCRGLVSERHPYENRDGLSRRGGRGNNQPKASRRASEEGSR